MSESIAEEPVFALTNSADEMVSLGRLTQRTTPGTVAHVIRKAILAGQLKPGSQLREIPLAADLGVSRAPLREALGLLAEEGLVERIPYKGAFVTEVNSETIAEIASLRKRLEPYAIELALPRLKGSSRIKVTRALEDMAIGADNNDPAATIEAHTAFHRAFYELCGHKLLRELWLSWEAKLQLFFSADHRVFADLNDVVAAHQRLLDIIDSGDMEVITDEIQRHVHGGVPAAEAGAAKQDA
jgi:DNA-binding GntR family transcriptional regulator